MLLCRALQAWYVWLGMRLAKATAQQERLLFLQVGCLDALFRTSMLHSHQPDTYAALQSIKESSRQV